MWLPWIQVTADGQSTDDQRFDVPGSNLANWLPTEHSFSQPISTTAHTRLRKVLWMSMQRRAFLQNLGTTLPAGLISGTAVATAAASETTGNNAIEPRVFMFDDGRHAACLYQFEAPLSPADLEFNVDQLVDSGIDTLVYFAGVEGGVVLYDSEVAQTWGDNVETWTHPVWYRAGRNIQQLIKDGHDPLEVLVKRCNKKGIFFLASNWVNLVGGDRKTHGGLGRKCDFVYEHPEYQVGPEDDPRAEYVSPERFSFLHAPVREYRFRMFAELLSRYTTDGIELNLLNDIPFCPFRDAQALTPLMTDWLRGLRAVAEDAEKSQQRRKRIYVRIPSQPDAWKILGYDVATWVREKLVDGLIVFPAAMEGALDQHADCSAAIELAHEHGCRVLAALTGLVGRQFEQYATQPMIWSAAANAYAQGADGFGLAQHHWTPNGWPWTAEDYQTLRLVGHPELLQTADKLYRANAAASQNPPERWLPGAEPALPQPLVEGQRVDIPLRVADRLADWHAEGKVAAVHLRIRITSIEPALNDVEIALNGNRLPEAALQLSDLIYRLHSGGAIGPYGYVYDYTLDPANYPRPGENVVSITLARKDPAVNLDFSLYDVDLEINYLPHRHFKAKPIRY